MRKSFSSRTASVLAALAVVLAATPVRAAENETFGIQPSPASVDGVQRRTFEIPLERGTTFRDRIRVSNRTNLAIELLLYAVDAETERGGEINVGFRSTKPVGVGSWIKLSRSTVQLGPKEEVVVGFTVHVESDAPSPDLGAIVAENTTRRSGGVDLAQRLHVVVKTAPPGTPVTAERVPRGLRSPWWWVGIAGLLVAAYVVWRRTRRGRSDVEPEREPDQEPMEVGADIGPAQPQVIHLGERPAEPAATDTTEIVLTPPDDVPRPAPKPVERRRAPARARRSVAQPQRAQTRRKVRTTADDRNYIPLDEL